jgi:hypothetical protein
MATRFEQLVAEIKTQFDVEWTTVAASPAVTFTTGVLRLEENDDANRVGWVRRGGRVGPPDAVGGKHHDEVEPAETVSNTAILVDAYDVEAFVWGQDAAMADRIREHVIRSAFKVLSPRSSAFAEWDDLTERRDEMAAHEAKGAMHRIRLQFLVPIKDFETGTELALLTSHDTAEDFVPGPLANPTDIDPSEAPAP